MPGIVSAARFAHAVPADWAGARASTSVGMIATTRAAARRRVMMGASGGVIIRKRAAYNRRSFDDDRRKMPCARARKNEPVNRWRDWRGRISHPLVGAPQALRATSIHH